MKSKKSFFIIFLWGFILVVTGACLAPAAPPSPPTPTPAPCSAPLPNMYSMQQLITSNYVADWSMITQQQALSLLVGQVERWSDYEDIVFDNNATYRVIITLITPELRRAAFITQAIHRHKTSAEIKSGIDQVATSQLDLDQLRFLVTVTLKYTGDNLMDAHDKFTIPLNNLIMYDRHQNNVTYSSAEGALLTSFDVVDGPYAAYITYPLQNQKCNLTIDVLSDTSVTLVLKGLKIGEKTLGDFSWTIDISPLIYDNLPTQVANLSTSPGSFGTYLEPKTIPPTPNPGDTNPMNLDNYWVDLSKFIWSKLSASNSR